MTTDVAPLLITVGPQCCGKTTYLSSLSGSVLDIAMDNMPCAYSSVDINQILGDIITPYGINMSLHSANAELVWVLLLFKDVCTCCLSCIILYYIISYTSYNL